MRRLKRPYLFKDSGYRFEQEIRFIIATDPEVTQPSGGALVDIDAASLILKISYSPKIEEAAKSVIDDLAMRILRGNEISLNVPLTYEEKYLQSLKIDLPRAFALEHGLPPLFHELE